MKEPTQMAAAMVKIAKTSIGLNWWILLIGLALPVLLVIGTTILGAKGSRNPWKLVQGADGLASTSKFQWFLWVTTILFAYTALWVLRVERDHHFAALRDVPTNTLTVLGFSTGTAVAAKGITSIYARTGRIAKPASEPSGSLLSDILRDDKGMPDLAKIQVVGFTLVTITIFIVNTIHQIAINYVATPLPNIDSSLMILTGISQAGYLGRKLVTFNLPISYALNPSKGPPTMTVTLSGANFGSSSTSRLMLNNSQIPFDIWTETIIAFSIPKNDPATGTPWVELPEVAKVAVEAGGQLSNSVKLVIIKMPYSLLAMMSVGRYVSLDHFQRQGNGS